MPKLLRLEVFSQSTRFYELIFAYCFYAGASAGMVSGGMSGEQAFFFFFLLFPAHLVSPCCYANAAHSQHGMFKDLPSSVAICTPQGLAVKATCMQDCCTSIPPACIGRELLPFQLSTVDLCTAWRLDPKALVLLPGFCIAVVPLLHVLKTWLLQGLS
jgi:hypothetical protein